MFFNNTIANYQAVVGSAPNAYPLATAFIAAMDDVEETQQKVFLLMSCVGGNA